MTQRDTPPRGYNGAVDASADTVHIRADVDKQTTDHHVQTHKEVEQSDAQNTDKINQISKNEEHREAQNNVQFNRLKRNPIISCKFSNINNTKLHNDEKTNHMFFPEQKELPVIPIPVDLPKPIKVRDIKVSTQNPKCFNRGLCLKCKKNETKYCYVPCGHVVVCEECANKVVPNDVCPLCQVPCQCAKLPFLESEKCCVCLSEKSSVMFLPCGHLCACISCSNALWENNKMCPICQQKCCSYKTVFPIY